MQTNLCTRLFAGNLGGSRAFLLDVLHVARCLRSRLHQDAIRIALSSFFAEGYYADPAAVPNAIHSSVWASFVTVALLCEYSEIRSYTASAHMPTKNTRPSSSKSTPLKAVSSISGTGVPCTICLCKSKRRGGFGPSNFTGL